MSIFWASTLLIFISTLAWFARTLFSKEDWRILSPFGLLMLCYLYYCALGPWVQMACGTMSFISIDFYDHIALSAGSAMVSFAFACAGYWFVRKRGQLSLTGGMHDRTLGFSLLFYFTCLTAVIMSQGGNLKQVYNIFGSAQESELGSVSDVMGFQMYLYSLIGALSAPVVLMWTRAEGSLGKRLLVLALLTNTLLVFLASGFRLRIAFLILSLTCLHFLSQRANPRWFSGFKTTTFRRLAKYALAGGALVVAMSAARKYGRGIDLEVLRESSANEVAVSAFNDSVIYYCGGETMDYVANYSQHTGLETYKAALLRMVPSAIIGEKPLPQTIVVINEAMGGNAASYSAGFAIPCYAEYYICFGWFGVVVGSTLMGACCAWVANLAIRRPTPYVLFFYALMTGFVFIYFHRGYFPQQLESFMFMVGVPMVAYAFIRHKMKG